MPIRPLTIGLFIIVGLGLFGALLFLIGDRQKAFSSHVEFQTDFADLSGLAAGAKVQVSGIDAGKIRRIDIPKNASEKFRLELQVQEKVHGMIHRDSVVSIQTEGVVGDKLVMIKRGTDRSPLAQPGDVLPSKEPVDLNAMMDRASGLLNDVHGSITDIRGRLDTALDSVTRTVDHTDGLITGVGPDVRKIAHDGSQISGNANSLVADVTAGKGPAGMLLKDEATKQQLQATISNIKDTSVNVNQASIHANQMIDDFQSRDLIAKAQVTLENVQAVSQQLNTTIKDALAQDNIGQNGAANLRETLSNLNRTTANLADDTEALKHNFLFRSFFKTRGFYSLDQITPNEYRQACERHREPGQRLWLDASQFKLGTDGKEELPDSGRRRIDEAVAAHLDQLPGRLIVIEGYATNGSPSQQFVSARQRADLVRRYLESQYHLRHSDLGIVALGSAPPQNAGRSNWDGAAIMLLESKSKQ